MTRTDPTTVNDLQVATQGLDRAVRTAVDRILCHDCCSRIVIASARTMQRKIHVIEARICNGAAAPPPAIAGN